MTDNSQNQAIKKPMKPFSEDRDLPRTSKEIKMPEVKPPKAED